MGRRKYWSATPSVQDVPSAVPAAVKSAARAFRIIEFFAEVRRPARANEIATRLSFPQSSTSMLLNSLMRLGYLDFDVVAHTYFPSLRTALLGSWLDQGHFRDGSIMKVMETLSQETGYAISLGTRSGIYVRFLHTIQATRPNSLHIPLSVRRYAVWSAAGIVLLTELPEPEIRKLVRLTKAEPGETAKAVDVHQVLEFVRSARELGYFLKEGFVVPNTQVLSMRLPKRLTGDWQEVALVIGGNDRDLDKDHIAVLDRAHELLSELD